MAHRVSLVSGLLALAFAGSAVAAPALPRFESRALAKAVASTASGGRFLLRGIEVAGTDETAALALERFDVFTSDAVIVVHDDEGETRLRAPRNAYFKGRVRGEPGSRVVLSVLENGTVHGVVARPGRLYLIGGEEAGARKTLGAPLSMHEVDPSSLKSASNSGFACAADRLERPTDPLAGLGAGRPVSALPAEKAAPSYTARVAIETDYEYYTLFDNATEAVNYAAQLIAYASTIYSAEVSTALLVPSMSLWATSNDPWAQNDSECGLLEFGRYWNLNRTNVPRTIAHFLSGKFLGGGIAWVGVLCSGSFSYNTTCPGLAADAPWGGGYGLTADLFGTFDFGNPTVMWDILAVSHEIGHNFNSPHTHCYNGIGDSSPVDRCFSGECKQFNQSGQCVSSCHVGGETLPGVASSGSGTIMGYCHQLGGGFLNVSLTLGTNHPYGVLPSRVPSRMSDHVALRASAFPGCLSSVTIFSDGLESGTAGLWQ